MKHTAADVKKLREETKATFAECKKALTAAKSWEEALKILENSPGRSFPDRETKQGGIFSYVHHNHSLGVLLELNCSTDFVARTENFQTLARDLALQIAGFAPQYVNFEDVPADLVETERQKILEDPALAHVPEAKRDDFISGKLRKVFSEQVLMLQPFVKDDTVTVGELVRQVIDQTGENIVLRRFSRFVLGE